MIPWKKISGMMETAKLKNAHNSNIARALHLHSIELSDNSIEVVLNIRHSAILFSLEDDAKPKLA